MPTLTPQTTPMYIIWQYWYKYTIRPVIHGVSGIECLLTPDAFHGVLLVERAPTLGRSEMLGDARGPRSYRAPVVALFRKGGTGVGARRVQSYRTWGGTTGALGDGRGGSAGLRSAQSVRLREDLMGWS